MRHKLAHVLISEHLCVRPATAVLLDLVFAALGSRGVSGILVVILFGVLLQTTGTGAMKPFGLFLGLMEREWVSICLSKLTIACQSKVHMRTEGLPRSLSWDQLARTPRRIPPTAEPAGRGSKHCKHDEAWCRYNNFEEVWCDLNVSSKLNTLWSKT